MPSRFNALICIIIAVSFVAFSCGLENDAIKTFRSGNRQSVVYTDEEPCEEEVTLTESHAMCRLWITWEGGSSLPLRAPEIHERQTSRRWLNAGGKSRAVLWGVCLSLCSNRSGDRRQFLGPP